MAFKNALKNLVTHFGVVWSLLLYIMICTAIIVGLSLPFVLPVARAFRDAGVFDRIGDAFSSLFNEGGWAGLWDGLYASYESVVGIFRNNSRVASLIMSFFILIPIVAIRFLLALYEIPLATVINGRMSCNAAYGLGGKFFSTLGVSVRYSLAKMPITLIFDAVLFGIIYGLTLAIGLSLWLPFALFPVLLVVWSLRCSLLACWAPSVADGRGVIKGLALSVKVCFKRFGSIYSTYFVTLLLLMSVGMFVSLFTLGVGIIIALPFSAACLGYLDATQFYNKSGRRYYIDGEVFTPPPEHVIVEPE